jgi:hypothetical protein
LMSAAWPATDVAANTTGTMSFAKSLLIMIISPLVRQSKLCLALPVWFH